MKISSSQVLNKVFEGSVERTFDFGGKCLVCARVCMFVLFFLFKLFVRNEKKAEASLGVFVWQCVIWSPAWNVFFGRITPVLVFQEVFFLHGVCCFSFRR